MDRVRQFYIQRHLQSTMRDPTNSSATTIRAVEPGTRRNSFEYASDYAFVPLDNDLMVHEPEPSTRPRSNEYRSPAMNADIAVRGVGSVPHPESLEDEAPAANINPTVQPERPLPATPPAAVFLRDLPIVPVDSLPEDGRCCHICHDPYLVGDECEHPVLLPCGHGFGHKCINRWLSPDQEEPKSTCPVCRRPFFDLPEVDDYEEEGEWNNAVPFNEADEIYEEEGLNDARFLRSVNERGSRHWDQTPPPRDAAEARYQRQIFDEEWNLRLSVLNFTRPFIPREVPTVRTALDILEAFRANRSPSWPEAEALGVEMGQLFMKLRPTMRLLKQFPIWNEYGPPAGALQHAGRRASIETQLLRFSHIEEALDWAHQGM